MTARAAPPIFPYPDHRPMADALGILDFACSLHDIVPPWRQPQPDLVLSA